MRYRVTWAGLAPQPDGFSNGGDRNLLSDAPRAASPAGLHEGGGPGDRDRCTDTAPGPGRTALEAGSGHAGEARRSRARAMWPAFSAANGRTDPGSLAATFVSARSPATGLRRVRRFRRGGRSRAAGSGAKARIRGRSRGPIAPRCARWRAACNSARSRCSRTRRPVARQSGRYGGPGRGPAAGSGVRTWAVARLRSLTMRLTLRA